MKKLSIEEKAKAYDKVAKEVKDFFEGRQKMYSDVNQTLEYLFPELIESEDERIRKSLIDMLKNDEKCYLKEIAWLEKQGENNLIEEIKRRKELLLHEKEKAVSSKDTLSLGGRITMLEELLAFTKKQGEQKHKIQPKFKIGDIIRFKGNKTLKGEAEIHKIISYDNELYVFDDGTTDLFCEQDLYELVEHKPVDKVEPKFKVGDWITNGLCSFKISSIDDNHYWSYEDTVGGDIESIDNQYHLWDIQDAKDGDVLAIDNIIFIYKTTLACHVVSYCKLMNCRFERFIDARTVCEGNRYIKPATKEQRDFLFQKMHEAGYEWDAKKKELRKIEQKHDWSEDDENRINRLIAYFEDKESFTAEDDVVYANWLKSLRPQKPLTNEEIEQAKKEYRDMALSKVDYIPEELTYDDGWDDAVSYIEKVFKTLYLTRSHINENG